MRAASRWVLEAAKGNPSFQLIDVVRVFSTKYPVPAVVIRD